MYRLDIIKLFSFLIAPWLFAAGARASSEDYLHDFERRSDLAAWRPYDATLGCTLTNPGAGGNPGGYLQVSCPGQFAGTWTRSADFTGDLSASSWTLSFDMANFGSKQADLVDIILYGAGTFWIYAGTLSRAANGAWMLYGLTFDPTWSDDQARANNWAPPNASDTTAASWATTLKQVEAIGFRTRTASGSDASGIQIGIDNVRLGSTH